MLCLVVDDDESVRLYIQTILQAEDFETLEAEDGLQALEIVRMLDGGVDLIVTDIQMPAGSGLTFARAVRVCYPFIAIILMSSGAVPDGGFEFVQKPFSWAVLSRAIGRVIPRAA